MKNYITIFIPLFFLFFACQEDEKQVETTPKFCLTDTLKTNLETVIAEVKIVENEIILTGKVTSNEDEVAKVYPLAGGFVQELHANLGDYVQKGQVLAVIRSPEIAGFASQSDVSQANLRVANKNYLVAQELYKTGTISELELTNAKKDMETASSEANRSKEMISMYNVGKASFYQVKAPSSGFVVNKDVALNMELRTEDVKPIFTISNLDNVWILANIYESDIDKVKEGYETDITTISYPDQILKGKIDKIFNVIDPETKVLKARIVLSNKDFKLKPEMFANVIVKYQDTEQKMTVPSKAVIFDKNKYFVMVYKGDCDIDTREIQVYKTTQSNTYLSGGLEKGEKVITKYQLLIYDALND